MDLEQQLRAALVPVPPRPQLRAAVMERIANESGRRGPKRWLLTGVVLALAAAAAMLATQLLDRGAAAVVVDTAPEPIAAPGVAVPLSSGVDPARAPVPQQAASPPPEGAVKTFTVQVLPLESDVEDAPRRAAIEAVFAALVEGLRAVPGLTLEELAREEVPADLLKDRPGAMLSTDFRISLEGRVPSPSATVAGDFFVNMLAERAGPDGRWASGFHTGMSGEIAPGCMTPVSTDGVTDRSSCADAAGVAAGLLATLRKMVFPPDPQLEKRLQARLIDQARDPAERLRALVDLGGLGRSSGAFGREEFAPALRDPAMIRAAIQLASTTPDPEARAQVWYTLRGSRDPALVRPLVSALRTDADDDTRVQALATLAADFPADPQVRPALETAAARDSNPMVRALAARALGAESAWTEYVLASLKDTGRPPVERIEALFHAYGLPTSRKYGSFAADGRILRALDDAAMRALTEVLPKAAADSERYAHSSLTLVSELANMDHPAITDMLLDSVRAGGTALPRRFVVEALRRRTADSRVRATLERIAAEDADPQVREMAARPLGPEEKGMPANSGPLPPRLGVATDYLKAAPDVPSELVGKLVVRAIGSGFPAHKAGMREGDVLLEVGGKPITSGPQLIEVLDALPRDVDVDVLVSRNGQTMRLTARF